MAHLREALLYTKGEHHQVHCHLCSHRCTIAEQKFGFCGVRQNISGTLYTHAYGKIIAAHVDPIEKKPLYHFLPGSQSFSIATIGCNFRCGFCQNWEISQLTFRESGYPYGADLTPEAVVSEAIASGCASISYTYTEPTVFFEYALDTARNAHDKGLRNVLVTNGYMTAEALHMIRPYLDAANIDLKFFNEQAYQRICSGSLGPVLDTIRLMHEAGIWVEITTLIIPGENDSEEELRHIAEFIAGIDPAIPWHVSRFHADYHFTGYDATPEATLQGAAAIAERAGLAFVYAGNVSGWGSDTVCLSCGTSLIERQGFYVAEMRIREGCCVSCGTSVPGVFA